MIAEKDMIENDMIRMASGMKEFANQFKTQFKRDEHVLKQIADKQDVNMKKTTKERDEIAEVQKQAVSSFCERIIMLIIAIVVFGVLMAFIWLFPNKVKYHVNSLH